MDRVNVLRDRITSHINPVSIEIKDESSLHVGHAGAVKGGGHFAVKVVSDLFIDKSMLERHRMIYESVDDLMPGEIHALSIQALTPEELALEN